MHPRCLGCDRSLGKNDELPHLRVGRRIAFDTRTGRLWVICRRCRQWNLVPLEERWEALEECERVTATADVRAPGNAIGLARTARGLELLRVAGHSSTDIANWRYARRFSHRRFALAWIATALAAIAVLLGVRAGIETASAATGVYVTAIAGGSLAYWWRQLPRVWLSIREPARGKRIWPWQIGQVRLARFNKERRPTLLVPDGAEERRLHGDDVARVLAGLLSKLNGADCVGVDIDDAVREVEKAESASRRRQRDGDEGGSADGAPLSPWEHIAQRFHHVAIADIDPTTRVALEMAVIEELEHNALAAKSEALGAGLAAEAEIASIADDLLMPSEITARVKEAKRAKRAKGSTRRQD